MWVMSEETKKSITDSQASQESTGSHTEESEAGSRSPQNTDRGLDLKQANEPAQATEAIESDN
jgi:hypothetical protein